MANMKLLAVFTRMVEDVEHTSVGHPSAGLRPEGLKPALRDPIWERLGPQGSWVGGVVGFLEEVALRWGLAEPTRQPDQLPRPCQGLGAPPLYGSPLPTLNKTPWTAWSQTRPSSPRRCPDTVGRRVPASRLGLETPSARNSPPTPPPRLHQGTARSPTCLLAVVMLA